MKTGAERVYLTLKKNRKAIFATIAGAFILSMSAMTFLSSVMQIQDPQVTAELEASGVDSDNIRKKFQESMLSLSGAGSSNLTAVPSSSSATDAFTAGAPHFEFSDTFSVDIFGSTVSLRKLAKFVRQVTGQRVVEIQLAIQCATTACDGSNYMLSANTLENGVPSNVKNFKFELLEDGLEGASADAAFQSAAAYLLSQIDLLDGIRFYIVNEQFDKAEELVSAGREDASIDQMALRRLHAEMALEQGDFSIGIGRFQSMIAEDADDYHAHEGVGRGLLATAMSQGGDESTLSRSIKTLQKAELLDQKTWRAPGLIALASASMDDDPNTERYALKALSKKFSDKDKRARLLLAMLLEDAGRCDLAWDEYYALAENDEPTAQAIVGGEFRQDNLNPRDDEQALSWLQRSADGNNAMGLVGLGVMYALGDQEYWLDEDLRTPDKDRALDLFKQAIDLGGGVGYSNWIATKLQIDGIEETPELREVIDHGVQKGNPDAEFFDTFLHSERYIAGTEDKREFLEFSTERRTGEYASDLSIAKLVFTKAMVHSLRYWQSSGIELAQPDEMQQLYGDNPHLGNYPKLAIRLYQFASLNGSPSAPLFYGLMLGDSDLAEHDPIEALKWLYIAEARNGSLTELRSIDSAPFRAALIKLNKIENMVPEPRRRQLQELANKPSAKTEKKCQITLQFDFGNLGPPDAI